MKRYLSMLSLLILSSLTGQTQEGPASWYEIELSKKLAKGFSIEIVPELRLNPDFSMDEYFIEGGLEYELFKPLKVAALYRYYREEKRKADEIGHKYIIDLKSGFDIKRFEFQGRIRFIDYISSTDDDAKYPLLRYRIKAGFNPKKSDIEPYMTAEFFHDYTNKEWNKIRYTIGAKYKLHKSHEIDLFCRYQDFIKNEEGLYIIGIGYCFKS